MRRSEELVQTKADIWYFVHIYIFMSYGFSAIGKAIPALLIYQGASGDLQSRWVDDVPKDSGVYFTTSENG